MIARRALLLLSGIWLGAGLASSLGAARAAETQAASWLAPTRLGLGQEPVVAVSVSGDAVAAWRSVENGGVVRASFRPAGGRWYPATEWPSFVSAPRAAIARDGTAIVAWIELREQHAVVEASFRPAGRRWSAPVQVSPANEWAVNVRVEMDAAGNALVAWRSSAWPDAVRTRYRPIGSGAWEPIVGISSYAYSELELAMAPGGRALLAWDVSKDVGHVIVAAVGERGSWGEPREIGGVQNGTLYDERPKALAPAIGDTVAVVAWQYATHGNGIVQAAVLPAAGAWEPAVDLSFADGQAFAPSVAIDGTGGVRTAWDATVDVEGSTRGPGASSWDRPAVVSPSQGAPTLAVNARGDAVALWAARDPSAAGAEAARQSAPSPGWGATTEVAPAGRIGGTDVAIDGAGDAVAVWERNDGRWWVEVAVSDVAPPVLTKLVVPAAAVARKSVRCSVTARDTWSRVAVPVWSFGDRSQARGTGVTHRYRKAGRYRVTVTVADALGHTTSETSTIRIRKR